jgi:hypothetical protein
MDYAASSPADKVCAVGCLQRMPRDYGYFSASERLVRGTAASSFVRSVRVQNAKQQWVF